MTRKGQAMIEAAGTLWILFLVFVCIYHTFSMALDKIRSLDTVYHLARSQEVKGDRNDAQITYLCFRGSRWMPSQMHTLTTSAGPAVQDVLFSFFPRGVQGSSLPWRSVMRVVIPERNFLSASWPGAKPDAGAPVMPLKKEQAAVLLRLHSNYDTAWDVADEVSDLQEANRG